MSKMLKVVGASWVQTKISSYILGFLGALAILTLVVGQFERIQEDGTYSATVFYSEKTGYRIEYWGQSNDLADIPRGVARAYFRMDIDTIGWSILEVETESSYPDEIQAYAAGIVEGALTWSLIHTHLDNTIRAKCEDQPLEKQCGKLKDALDRSVNIWKTTATERESTEPFWHQVSLYYTQINGIFTGWKHGVERSQNEYDTDISDLYWLNSLGEITEIQRKLNITVQDEVLDRLPSASSAFLRITNETDEEGNVKPKLFVAHNSAGSYNTMMRILKRYKLNFHQTSATDSPIAPGSTVEFASYPGSVTSQDEFYSLVGQQHKMVVAGIALRNYNVKLWKDVNITEQVPVGPRVTAANHLAPNVSAWGHILASSNSGTGCKQWLVVDYQKFEDLANSPQEFEAPKVPRKDVVTEISIDGKNKDIKHTVVHRSGGGRAKGLLWLIEQVPARTHSADLSDAFLEQSYFGTHGLPIFKDIADITHTTKMEELYGDMFSQDRSPGAQSFKAGFGNATTLPSIIRLMRQNNLTASNETNNCTENEYTCILKTSWSVLGIRGDIIGDFKAYGVIDTKVVSNNINTENLEFVAVAGPPFTHTPTLNLSEIPMNKGNVAAIYTDQFDNEDQIDGLEIRDLVKHQKEEAIEEYIEKRDKKIIKPFQWSESPYNDEEHEGLPDEWVFEPFKTNWSWDEVLDRLPSASSAFLRITNETDEEGNVKPKLFVAHNSAGSYNTMMRILKRYKLNFHQTSATDSPIAPGSTVEFASYPGSVTSQDEFYSLVGQQHKMVVAGIALRNYNVKLWKDVNITEQVPVGPRVTAANHLAPNVSAWGHILASSNSGTGCKQWLVVDYQKFEDLANSPQEFEAPKVPRKDVVTEISIDGKNKDIKHTVVHRSGGGRAKGLLWLIEQVPARTHSADLSDAFLEQSYFGTHGLPIFKDIADITHTTKMEELYGDMFSQDRSPGAQSFKAGFGNATTLPSIIRLMRQNNLTASNETNNCTENEYTCILKTSWSVLGIRGDIIGDFKAYGVIDTKVVSNNINTENLEFVAVAGPPFTHTPTLNLSEIPMNKGNVAAIYTDQFDNEDQIDGLEIRDLVKHQKEEAIEEYIEKRDKKIIKPFQWSESPYNDEEHEGLPDEWVFEPFKTNWSW